MSARDGFDCPACGARLRGGRPGAVVPCAECRNPIVVPEPTAEAPPAPRPAEERAPAPAFDADQARRKLLTTATIVLVLVGVAHFGLYKLLTREARTSMADIESRHAVSALENARPPEGDPKPGTPEYRTWREAKALWVDAEAWRNDRRQASLLEKGILGSFIVQVAITIWVLLRLLGTVKRRARGRKS